MKNPKVLCLFLVVLNLILSGCSWNMATQAVMPSSLTSYNDVFDAATELVTDAGYSVTQTDKKSGIISGVKQISGHSLSFNMVIKRDSKSRIVVNVTRSGGKFPLLNSVWKADARSMLKNFAQRINIPENKITVTMGEESSTLDQF